MSFKIEAEMVMHFYYYYIYIWGELVSIIIKAAMYMKVYYNWGCNVLGYLYKVRKRAKISNRYNQAPHLTQDTNGKVTTSQLEITN